MIPTDCVIVKLKAGVSHFTSYTWNSHGTPKTIPLDLYYLNKDRLDVVDDPYNLLEKVTVKEKPKEEIPEKTEETVDESFDLVKEIKDVVDEAEDLVSKVKKRGKGKNKKR